MILCQKFRLQKVVSNWCNITCRWSELNEGTLKVKGTVELFFEKVWRQTWAWRQKFITLHLIRLLQSKCEPCDLITKIINSYSVKFQQCWLKKPECMGLKLMCTLDVSCSTFGVFCVLCVCVHMRACVSAPNASWITFCVLSLSLSLCGRMWLFYIWVLIIRGKIGSSSHSTIRAVSGIEEPVNEWWPDAHFGQKIPVSLKTSFMNCTLEEGSGLLEENNANLHWTVRQISVNSFEYNS